MHGTVPCAVPDVPGFCGFRGDHALRVVTVNSPGDKLSRDVHIHQLRTAVSVVAITAKWALACLLHMKTRL